MFTNAQINPNLSKYYSLSTEIFQYSSNSAQWFINLKIKFSQFLALSVQIFDAIMPVLQNVQSVAVQTSTNMTSDFYKHNQYLNYFIETYFTGIINYKQLDESCQSDFDCENYPNSICSNACAPISASNCTQNVCKCRQNFIQSLNGLSNKPICGELGK